MSEEASQAGVDLRRDVWVGGKKDFVKTDFMHLICLRSVSKHSSFEREDKHAPIG